MKVSELYIHPLKSAASISVDQAELDAFGLKYDRRWMLVDEKGDFLSQRQQPEMCLIHAIVDSAKLKIKVPDRQALTVTHGESNKMSVQVWGDICEAVDCGDDAAHYISEFLSIKCRLVYFPDDEIRQVDLEYAQPGDQTGFSDGFPLLLISQASLDDLNSRLERPVTMNRFRPNIVVSGTEAFAEDQWKVIKVGNITMRVVKPCSRCSIPSVDPLTALRSAEPIKTLRDYRMRNHKVYFGQNVIADTIGELVVGMDVEIIE